MARTNRNWCRQIETAAQKREKIAKTTTCAHINSGKREHCSLCGKLENENWEGDSSSSVRLVEPPASFALGDSTEIEIDQHPR